MGRREQAQAENCETWCVVSGRSFQLKQSGGREFPEMCDT